MPDKMIRTIIVAGFLVAWVVGLCGLAGCQTTRKQPDDRDPPAPQREVVVDEGPDLD